MVRSYYSDHSLIQIKYIILRNKLKNALQVFKEKSHIIQAKLKITKHNYS